MKLFDGIFRVLQKPFPIQESWAAILKTTAFVSAFVTFFLYIFEPFGIGTLEANKFLICLGFGFMTFVATVVFEFLVGPVLKLKGQNENWTFGKWIVYILGVILNISLANFLFARLLIFGYVDWELLPQMIYSVFMIGLIPVVVIGALSLGIQEKRYQNIAEHINSQNRVRGGGEQVDETLLFGIPLARIKYVEALQNYVQIGYTDPHGQYKKQMERATLKSILEETAGSSIIRSHRSFLVNRNAIQSISGNAQGLVLRLSGCDRYIPVSRSYVPVFREL